MNYTFENGEKSTVKLTIEFATDEWQAAIAEAYVKNRSKYSVNGFRPGKAPKHILENYYGKGLFYEPAINDLFDKHYPEIIEKEEKSFTVVGQPELSIGDLSEEKLSLIAVIPVKPDVKLGAYKGIKVKKVEYNVTDEDVENEIKKLLDKKAELKDVEGRAAQNGDTVIIDFCGTVEGKKFDGGTAEDYELALGSGSFIPGFEPQIEGMNIGDDKDIGVTFPEEYHSDELKGKDAVFAIKLKAIKEKLMPELNDEFIKANTSSESVEAYRAETKKKMCDDAEKNATQQTENNIVKAIVATSEVELPQAMIENQIDSEVRNFEYRLMYQGLKLDDYLKYLGVTREEFRKNYASHAQETVISQLVIDKIVRLEDIKAEQEEIDEKIKKDAESVEKSFDDYKAGMQPRQLEYIENEIVIDKLFAFLLANNELIVDYTGEDDADKEAPAAKKPAAKKAAAKKPAAKSEAKSDDASQDGDKAE